MRAAFALRINSGKIIFICKSGKSADFPDLPFHRRGRNGKLQRQRPLSADAAALREISACGKAGFSGRAFARLPFHGKGRNGRLQRQRPLSADAAALREIPACGKAGFSGRAFERLPFHGRGHNGRLQQQRLLPADAAALRVNLCLRQSWLFWPRIYPTAFSREGP